MSNSLTINTPNIVKQNTPLRNVPSGSTAEPDYSVKYVPQTLTEAQQAQARQNIGAGTPQVQADWNQTNTSAPDYIKNKPEITPGGGATINEFVYTRTGEPGSYTGVISCTGYEPKEGDLMTISFQGPFYTDYNPVTLNNGTTNPTVTLLNAEVNATDYDEINPEINTKWTVRLTKVNDAWVAVNISTQVQADWNTSDTTMPSYIKNKPAVSEDIVEDKTDVLTIYSDKETDYTFDNGQMLDIWKNGVHTKLGNVGDNVRTVRLARGKNILKFNGLFGTEFSDKSGHYTIVCPVGSNLNTLVNGTYTGHINIFNPGSGYWMNTATGSTVFSMNNNTWQGVWTRSGDVVFVDKPMNNLGDGNQQSPTFPANYYVPKSRYNEFITKMETIYASSYIDVLKTKVIQYDFLTIDPDYNVSIVILPTLPLTMTDANNNTISGDFVAQNITIA